jgi:hypothetical protein
LVKKSLKNCDDNINEINKEIANKNKKIKQKGGELLPQLDSTQKLYLLIPSDKY